MCTYLFIKSLRDISNNLDSFVLTFFFNYRGKFQRDRCVPLCPVEFSRSHAVLQNLLFHSTPVSRTSRCSLIVSVVLLFSRPRSFVAPVAPAFNKPPAPPSRPSPRIPCTASEYHILCVVEHCTRLGR